MSSKKKTSLNLGRVMIVIIAPRVQPTISIVLGDNENANPNPDTASHFVAMATMFTLSQMRKTAGVKIGKEYRKPLKVSARKIREASTR
jgi:hypothetical protein